VSSKQLTSFSDFRLPFEHPDHLTLEVPTLDALLCYLRTNWIDSSPQEYVDYLRAYCKNFGITERIHLQTKVVSVSRNPDGGHIVSYVKKTPSGEWESSKPRIFAHFCLPNQYV
jgi:dimethylaniline monooxygenase (N-oxide forming)